MSIETSVSGQFEHWVLTSEVDKGIVNGGDANSS